MSTHKLGFWEAYAIGIGGMIGGGIFAVLGLTLRLAQGAAPVAFLFAGAIALLTSYSYAKLSIRYPSQGGTVEFLVRAFGNNLVTAYLNTLLLASYVIMLALYAYAFGSYASALFLGHEVSLARNVFIVLVVALFTFINFLGAYISGKAEDLLVAIKVGILLLFSALGFFTGDFTRLAPEHWPGLVHILTGGLVIFLAYEGFELIANTAQDVADPERTLPKAFYAAVSTVIGVYVLVATVAVANLTPEQVEKYQDYALAVAAEPILGKVGFALIGIAALVSTASAINATLYGNARVSYLIARFGALPRGFTRRVWKQGTEGLLILAGLTVAFALAFNLENISVAGSLGFLLIFAAVNLANVRLARYTDAQRWISLLGFVLCAVAMGVLVGHTYRTQPQSLRSATLVLVATLLFEVLYRTLTRIRLQAYIDEGLREREAFLDAYEGFLHRLVGLLKSEFPEAEVYLVGRLAEKPRDAAGSLNVWVVVEEAPERLRRFRQEMNARLHLKGTEPLHLRFLPPRKKKRLPKPRKRLA